MQASRRKPPDESTSDSALVARARQGDRSAFDRLVLKYQHKVTRVIARHAVNPADVPDIAQETFVRAYRALRTFRGDSAFYTWLYRVAFNTAMKHVHRALRQRANIVYLDLESEPRGVSASFKELDTPEGIALSEEVRRALNEAIAELPEDLRTALLLREIAGMSYGEIAQVASCPVGTVRSRIFRARDAVDKRLQPLLA